MTKGQRIKQKRESLGIGQTDLANKIGVSKQTLYKYENDIITNIPSDVIEKLSHALGCTPAYIMGWDDNEDIKSFIKKFQALSQDQQQLIMDFMETLVKRIEEKN